MVCGVSPMTEWLSQFKSLPEDTVTTRLPPSRGEGREGDIDLPYYCSSSLATHKDTVDRIADIHFHVALYHHNVAFLITFYYRYHLIVYQKLRQIRSIAIFDIIYDKLPYHLILSFICNSSLFLISSIQVQVQGQLKLNFKLKLQRVSWVS